MRAHGHRRGAGVGRGYRLLAALALAALAGVALTIASATSTRHVSVGRRPRPSAHRPRRQSIHKIKHVVVIMQENRSFDSYFGTYPGADGIPGLAGNPNKLPCVPDPAAHDCVKPYYDSSDITGGGPHLAVDAVKDIDGGKMDGHRQPRVGPISTLMCWRACPRDSRARATTCSWGTTTGAP